MGYYLGSIIVCILVGLFLKYMKVDYPFSRAVLVLIVLNLVAGISLVENISQNQRPEINGGIGLTNGLTKLIISEDGWSHELFKKAFDQSILFTMILLFVYFIILIAESKLRRKTKDSAS